MRRKIYLTVSQQAESHLAGGRCKEYLHLYDQEEKDFMSLSKRIDWGCGYKDFEEYTNKQFEKSTKLYKSLSSDEQLAVEERSRVESINDEINRKIGFIWRAKKFPSNINDVEDEAKFIEVMRLKYVYPDYYDLVGKPHVSDFNTHGLSGDESRGSLTGERKADLLLLGVFQWKGMYIARSYKDYHNNDDPGGWLVCRDENYEQRDSLGVWFVDYEGKWSRPTGKPLIHGVNANCRYLPNSYHDIKFYPFKKIRSIWLHNLLVDCDIELGNRQNRTKRRVKFKDGNQFNCLPDNLLLTNPGRKMLCKECGRETTPDDSRVIRDGQKKLRYCYRCLKE